jgi:ABC-type lipoprotein export system ATPase subunit
MVTHNPECAARALRQIHLLDGQVVDLHPEASPVLHSGSLSPAAPA